LSLDALAPDQRAVVQLVLQQDRSYGDLAALLGITEDAVRERAHRGLERIAPADDVAPHDRAEVADYLLGQQSVSGRETTRSLLAGSPAAAAWATALAGTLGPIARSPLPEIPGAGAPVTEAEPVTRSRPQPAADVEPAVRARPTPVTEDEPVVRSRPRPDRADRDVTAEEPVVRARPRPRAGAVPETVGAGSLLSDTPATEDALAPIDEDDVPGNSLMGGALVIGGLGILVAILIVWLVTKGGDDNKDTASKGVTATATASSTTADGTPGPTGTNGTANDFAAVGTIDLAAQDGSKAVGRIGIFASQSTQQIGFELIGTGLAPTTKTEAYGVWLIGGGKPHFLGYAPQVASTGKTAGQLGTTGPREQDQALFAQWLQSSKTFEVTRETQQNPTTPGSVVLAGNIADFQQVATATPTP
jgi:hypothetical protein